MSKSYAIVENAQIINVVIADDDYGNSQGWIPLPEGGAIGDTYVDGTLIKRVPGTSWDMVRGLRDMLLTQSDTNILPDRWASMTPEKQQEWAIYRQVLRDIPQTFATPEKVVWPIRPE